MIDQVLVIWRAKRHQILITWLAAWPTLTIVLYALQPVSRDWPVPLRSLASATAMVLMMNFISVPTVKAIAEKLRHMNFKP
jgi:antibiotic biosynthesis monooxygenase (ABM) superfamily enzyme